jgi:hypothetical protein
MCQESVLGHLSHSQPPHSTWPKILHQCFVLLITKFGNMIFPQSTIFNTPLNLHQESQLQAFSTPIISTQSQYFASHVLNSHNWKLSKSQDWTDHHYLAWNCWAKLCNAFISTESGHNNSGSQERVVKYLTWRLGDIYELDIVRELLFEFADRTYNNNNKMCQC